MTLGAHWCRIETEKKYPFKNIYHVTGNNPFVSFLFLFSTIEDSLIYAECIGYKKVKQFCAKLNLNVVNAEAFSQSVQAKPLPNV
jgi:hypothetical protein